MKNPNWEGKKKRDYEYIDLAYQQLYNDALNNH
jgi:hypothetical protein